ncbi:sorting nexin 1-like [Iris pallida]|uniref:Sorting nexin 1-like n=1 Tax=Iris pallida TaxID=29817 RepID=A0AAX6H7R7_IRIPA|nr:sorting nexin 1-like [Iris pallida]
MTSQRWRLTLSPPCFVDFGINFVEFRVLEACLGCQRRATTPCTTRSSTSPSTSPRTTSRRPTRRLPSRTIRTREGIWRWYRALSLNYA